jgi:hypothetical protein
MKYYLALILGVLFSMSALPTTAEAGGRPWRDDDDYDYYDRGDRYDRDGRWDRRHRYGRDDWYDRGPRVIRERVIVRDRYIPRRLSRRVWCADHYEWRRGCRVWVPGHYIIIHR